MDAQSHRDRCVSYSFSLAQLIGELLANGDAIAPGWRVQHGCFSHRRTRCRRSCGMEGVQEGLYLSKNKQRHILGATEFRSLHLSRSIGRLIVVENFLKAFVSIVSCAFRGATTSRGRCEAL
jgi:hypothetical protein